MRKITDEFNPYALITKNQELSQAQDFNFNKTESLVNEIYISLCAIFKGCFVSNVQLEIDAYKKQLFLSFQQFQINQQEQIEKGLFNARSADLKYFPSTKQVIDWCLDVQEEQEPMRQTDTRDRTEESNWGNKTEEEKLRSREYGKSQLKAILELLRS